MKHPGTIWHEHAEKEMTKTAQCGVCHKRIETFVEPAGLFLKAHGGPNGLKTCSGSMKPVYQPECGGRCPNCGRDCVALEYDRAPTTAEVAKLKAAIIKAWMGEDLEHLRDVVEEYAAEFEDRIEG